MTPLVREKGVFSAANASVIRSNVLWLGQRHVDAF